MKYSFHPLARQELKDAIDHYNKCRDDLGAIFIEEVYKAVHLILQFPQAWSPFSKNTRRCLINRFPYGIIYQNTEEKIIIIAVMQLNKEPHYWHKRNAQD
jgi:plasmid stabilization system protein ParE